MVGSTYSATKEDTRRKLIISLVTAAAVTAAAAPAFAHPPDPCLTRAHVAAIVWHSGGGCNGPGCHVY